MYAPNQNQIFFSAEEVAFILKNLINGMIGYNTVTPAMVEDAIVRAAQRYRHPQNIGMPFNPMQPDFSIRPGFGPQVNQAPFQNQGQFQSPFQSQAPFGYGQSGMSPMNQGFCQQPVAEPPRSGQPTMEAVARWSNDIQEAVQPGVRQPRGVIASENLLRDPVFVSRLVNCFNQEVSIAQNVSRAQDLTSTLDTELLENIKALVIHNPIHLSSLCYQPREICIAAINSYPMAIRWVHEQTDELCELALQKDPEVIQYIKNASGYSTKLAEKDFVKNAGADDIIERFNNEVSKSVTGGGYAVSAALVDKVQELVTEDPALLSRLVKQPERICIAAIEACPLAIQWVIEPTEKLRKLAESKAFGEGDSNQ